MSVNSNIGGINNTQSTQGLNGVDLGSDKLSIADKTMLVMLERSEILEGQIRDQINAVHEKNQQLQKLSDIQSKLRNMKTNTQTVNEATWTVNQDVSPKEIALDNGYTLQIHADDQAWSILDAEGNETKVWGDPHVNEGDADGNKNWDFQQDATFVLDDGTKIHVGTKDIGREDKNVVTDTLTITKGNQSIQVTGIADDTPTVGTPALDGAELDAATNDGHVFLMGDQVDDWVYKQAGDGAEIGSAGWENVTEGAGPVEYEHASGTGEDSNINTVLNQEELALLDELGINVFDNSNLGALTPDEIDNLLSSIKSTKDSLTSMSQLEMVKLQSYNGKYEQTNSMASQVMKSQFGQAKEILRNI